MSFASDSGDWTEMLFQGRPFSEVLRLAAARAQIRADVPEPTTTSEPDAPTIGPGGGRTPLNLSVPASRSMTACGAGSDLPPADTAPRLES